jgi:RsiW-degrading membrane proteinase PrsW (M82 family)
MAIIVTCFCGTRLKARDELAGKQAVCSVCGKVVAIPGEPKTDVRRHSTSSRAAEPASTGRQSPWVQSGATEKKAGSASQLSRPRKPEPPPLAELVSPGELAQRVAPKPDPPSSVQSGYQVIVEAPTYPAAPVAMPEPEAPFDDDDDDREPEPFPRPVKRKRRLRRDLPAHSSPPMGVYRHLHWILVLALIPLGYSLLLKEDEKASIEKRLVDTIQKAPQDVQRRIHAKGENLDDVFDLLPNQRLEGAHLPHNTWAHWGYAGLSVVLFLGFFLIISGQDAHPLSMPAIGIFTATVGILLLFIVQFLAAWTQGRWFIGRSVLVIIFYIAKFIGFSYRSALDPDSNFFVSFFGFTFGVGLCEELCKALPILYHFRRQPTLNWRGAFLWGLSSGGGFGVAEGIMYSSSYYNGIEPFSTYLVRFVSCVALHAIWTGSVGIMIYKCQAFFEGGMEWHEYILPFFRVLGVAMILHGLYDTLLKKEMNALALAVAVASFGWLAFLIWDMSRENEDEEESIMDAVPA